MKKLANCTSQLNYSMDYLIHNFGYFAQCSRHIFQISSMKTQQID